MSEEHEEYEVEALGVEVNAQPIELYKVLKIANAVSGGGEAKFAISEGYVAVNGELEQRKRRKVYDGDVVEFNNEFYLVLCDKPVTEASDEPVKPQKPAAEPSQPARGKVRSLGQEKSSAKSAKSKKSGAAAKGKVGGKANGRAGTQSGAKANQPDQSSNTADKTTGRKLLSF
ncbi:RNA-binding S4 domain-containing protein [Photobacterium nomapromontoriensis]